jgi:hypothetical protein
VIAVLIPSRDRPAQAAEAVASVRATSDAAVFLYCDSDATPYPKIEGAEVLVGERVGSARAINLLVHHAYEARRNVSGFIMIPDDARMRTPGWDKFVLNKFDQCPGDISVVSPACSPDGEHRVDMPAISCAFFNKVGFFAHRDTRHYAWPSIVEALSEGICLYRASRDEFAIDHPNIGSTMPSFETDAGVFYRWYAWHRAHARRALSQAIPWGIR